MKSADPTSGQNPPPREEGSPSPTKSFREAGEAKELSLGQEIIQMLKHNKKYWMIPLLIFLLVLGVIVVIAATSPGVAPFIYTLF
jgi:hypothetical protein